MQFYDATNKSGICQKIDFLCSTNDTQFPRLQKTREVNNALEALIGEVINADGTWQWDDTNHTDLPIGTGDLVDGQSSYTFASEYLDIENIKVRDANGNWNILTPIDQSQTDVPLEDFLTDNGLPFYYDKLGDTINLYPAPAAADVYASANIKVQFKRTAALFAYASTTAADTQEPGLASPYHELLAYKAAIPYCMAYKKDRVVMYEEKVKQMTKQLIAFYGRREKDKRKVMTMEPINFR
jgi:hypothetical protein